VIGMNREQKRRKHKQLKNLSTKEFWQAQNALHTKAYAAAQRHYHEAMDVVLQPKQKAAVIAQAKKIRELWDGMLTVTTDETVAEIFNEGDEADDRTTGD
jgi:predicted metal-dependent HD superfamily phosphohydrolase